MTKDAFSPSPAVNFINIYAHVFCTKFWRQSQNVTRKAAKKGVCTKKAREKNVDEIVTWKYMGNEKIKTYIYLKLILKQLFFIFAVKLVSAETFQQNLATLRPKRVLSISRKLNF